MDKLSVYHTVNSSLVAVRIAVLALGETGKKEKSINPFGNTTLLADVKAGEAVFAAFEQAELEVLFVSEEHGKEYKIGKNPKYLAVIDELDGSGAYKDGNGRHGTMVAVFDSLNPNYNDYLVAGIVDHTTGEIYLAQKGKGVQCNKMPVHCSGATQLDPTTTRIRVDGWFPENLALADKLVGYPNMFIGVSGNGGASCAYYMDLVSGKADLVIECTRKRNLEMAVAYGLITEADGVMVDIEGHDLGSKMYLDFGQTETDRLTVISAASLPLAQDFLDKVKSTHV